MESISRVQHTSKWEQTKPNKILFCFGFFFLWNLLAFAFQTHSPLLADCFTAIMSKLMMCLAVRQLIQLAAMPHLKMLISSAAYSFFFYDWHEHSHWTVCLLPLSPHTQHTNSNIYTDLVNMQPCLLNVGSFIVEEWGVEESSNHCWKKSDSAPHSGSPAWGCPIPSRIRQGVFFRGGALLSGQASIIVFLITWL